MSFTYDKIELGEIAEYIRNGLSVRQTKELNGLPITRIETIWNETIDPQRVGYAGIHEGDKDNWLLDEGDILISHINSKKHLGKCALFQGTPKQLIHGMNLLCLRPNKRVTPAYLIRVLQSSMFKSQISSIRKDSVNQSSFNVTNFKKLSIPLPPVEEQKRIAAILDKADAIRHKRQAAIKLADDFLRATFLDMFGDPVTNPKGWEVKSLNELVDFKTGKLDSNAAVINGRYPFFTCSRETFKINTYAFDGEALLLAGNNAAAEYSVKYYNGKFNAYQRTYVITILDDQLSYRYLQVALEMKLQDLKRLSKGTNTKYLTLGILKDITLQAPRKEARRLFDRIIQKIDSYKTKFHQESAMADDVFNSLTQRAFRGEL